MFEKKNFCLRILCVSQKFGPRIFVKKNFVFWKRTLSYNQNFVFGKRIFVPEFCVCVCLRIFVSEFCVCVCLRIFVSEFLGFLSASSQCIPVSFFKDIICSYYT